jgi:hypothetical protein
MVSVFMGEKLWPLALVSDSIVTTATHEARTRASSVARIRHIRRATHPLP